MPIKSLVLKLFFISSIYFFNHNPVIFVGNTQEGFFNFSLFPSICIDPYTQLIFAGAAINPPMSNGQSMSYTISVYDSKNFKQKKIFLPLITKNALVNDILESNPFWNSSLTSLQLLAGLTLEPKFYLLATLVNDSHIYIFNNLNIYDHSKNHLVTTDALMDTNGNDGNIIAISTGNNEFTAAVLPHGTIFNNTQSALLYDFIVKERIVPIPGSTNYYTLLKINPVATEYINNQNPFFLMGADTNCTIIGNNLSLGCIAGLNSFYTGFSGFGNSGIKIVSRAHGNIIPQAVESTITQNKIVLTKTSNTPLYLSQITGCTLSTGLSYLVILGGTIASGLQKSVVYAMPVINFVNQESNQSGEIGQLANINSQPQILFNSTSPYLFLNTVLTEAPVNEDDLYSANDYRAFVGAIPLIFHNKALSFQNIIDTTITSPFIINQINTYKDTIFSNVSYTGNDGKAIGGIFYSQALLNEFGGAARWSLWMRKDINGDIINSTYIPSMGCHFALYQAINNAIVANDFSLNGSFPIPQIIEKTAAAKTGIQKIIDIPYTHPAIGFNSLTVNNLCPSYALYVGNNTIILQQTAANSGMMPLILSNPAYGENGYTPTISNSNTMIVFQGGILEKSGVLWSADLAFNDTNAWLVAAGSHGIFILADKQGNGTGDTFLQENFIGLNQNQFWHQLGDFGLVKKIIPTHGYLYVLTQDSIWRIPLTPGNIQAGKNCQKNKILSVLDLPNANNYSSFSDALISQQTIIVASSCGLFVHSSADLATCAMIIPKQIILPESYQAMPVNLYPISYNGCSLDWANGPSDQVCGNIYVLATSISQHYSMIYRLVSYGSKDNPSSTSIKLIPNFFIKNVPTYYYNPGIELLSIASDGASLFSHGVTGNSILFRSYIGLINPFAKHGLMQLKAEYNFFDLFSQSNVFLGYPTYISGLGVWLFVGQNGIQGLS